MTRWPRKPLAEVATIGSGAGFPIADQGKSDGEYPFLKVSDMNLPGNARTIESWNNTVTDEVRARLRATAFPTGSVIFPKIGAAIGTNKKRLLTRPCCVDNNVMAVTPERGSLEPEYLFYLLLATDISHFASDSNPPSIRKTVVEAWEVPVPPLSEQRRIVDVLSRAEGIVRLRREAQAKAAEIIPALFLDMFGDPATNPKGWPEASLGELVEEFRYGTSQKSGVAGLATLRIPNVIGDRLDPSEIKLVSVTEAEANRLRLRTGDLLFVRTNGNPDYVGRSAVFEPEVISAAGYDGLNCIYASYLIRARLKAKPVRPGFLQSFLSSHEGRKRLREQARTSAGQYNINTEGLSSILVPVPPLNLQAHFEERCRSVLGIVAQQAEAFKNAEATFRALLSRAFSDDLGTTPLVAEEAAVA